MKKSVNSGGKHGNLFSEPRVFPHQTGLGSDEQKSAICGVGVHLFVRN